VDVTGPRAPGSTIHFFGCQLGQLLLLWQQHVARSVVVVYQWQLIGDAFDDDQASLQAAHYLNVTAK